MLITDALPSQSYVTYSLKVLYTINLFFSYPLQLAPAVNLFESYVFGAQSTPTKGRFWAQNLVRTLMVLFTISVGLAIYCQISVFIEVIAAATCSPLAFTLPAWFHYKLKGQNKSDLAIVIVTILLTVFMVGNSIFTLVKSLTSDEQTCGG